jgi:hypothetical protein
MRGIASQAVRLTRIALVTEVPAEDPPVRWDLGWRLIHPGAVGDIAPARAVYSQGKPRVERSLPSGRDGFAVG